jgi:bifunctional non-homologous end joining protein LigD
VISKPNRQERKDKVFVDWSQNDRHKTTVSVYSLRARARPTVSTPVTWDEVSGARDSGDQAMLVFEHDETLARIEEHGDLFEPVLTMQQRLPKI